MGFWSLFIRLFPQYGKIRDSIFSASNSSAFFRRPESIHPLCTWSPSESALRTEIHSENPQITSKELKKKPLQKSSKKHPKTSRIDNVKEDDLYYSNSQLNSIVENQFHTSNSSKRDSSSSEEKIILKSKNPKENNDSIEIDPQLLKNKLVRIFSAWKYTVR